jgi:ATP adenylyltransferase
LLVWRFSLAGLLGKSPAGGGIRFGGRNSLRESAQEATLSSLSIAGTASQLKGLQNRAFAGFSFSPAFMHCFAKFLSLAEATKAPVQDVQRPFAQHAVHPNARASILTLEKGFAMDYLWTPWRYAYITTADTTARPGVPPQLAAWPGPDAGCVFCNLLASIDWAIAEGMTRDEAEQAGNLVYRGRHCFVCLNAFPYSNGHILAMPYAHLDRLAKLPAEAAHELMDLAQLAERAMQNLYRPDGFNFGMNLGRAAGAGVAGHLHLHGLPRWAGDTNFMTTIAETRVVPEDLKITQKRLRDAFAELIKS